MNCLMNLMMAESSSEEGSSLGPCIDRLKTASWGEDKPCTKELRSLIADSSAERVAYMAEGVFKVRLRFNC